MSANLLSANILKLYASARASGHALVQIRTDEKDQRWYGCTNAGCSCRGVASANRLWDEGVKLPCPNPTRYSGRARSGA